MTIPSFTDLSIVQNKADALSNLLLVQPSKNTGSYQPYNSPGPIQNPQGTVLQNAFLFDFEGEQSVILDSDITDHYIEDNSTIQDQIALKPIVITTQGFISELNDIVPTELQPIFSVVQKLSLLSAFAPQLTTAAQSAYNSFQQLYQNAKKLTIAAGQAWASLERSLTPNILGFTEEPPIVQTKQQIAFNKFLYWWSQRILFTVQTPWNKFQNMAIKTLKPIQSADTRTITNFEITFKQIRVASTAILPNPANSSQGRRANQASTPVNTGFSQGQNPVPFGSTATAAFPGLGG